MNSLNAEGCGGIGGHDPSRSATIAVRPAICARRSAEALEEVPRAEERTGHPPVRANGIPVSSQAGRDAGKSLSLGLDQGIPGIMQAGCENPWCSLAALSSSSRDMNPRKST